MEVQWAVARLPGLERGWLLRGRRRLRRSRSGARFVSMARIDGWISQLTQKGLPFFSYDNSLTI